MLVGKTDKWLDQAEMIHQSLVKWLKLSSDTDLQLQFGFAVSWLP